MIGSIVVKVHPLPETSSDILAQKATSPQCSHDEEFCRPLIDYDRAEIKSIQELLYEAARETDQSKFMDKWSKFEKKIIDDKIPSSEIRNIISTLDDKKHWAALHYAVECNNLDFCKLLTSKHKWYKCDVNMLSDNGENVLHVAATSDQIWSDDASRRSALDLITFLVDKLKVDINHADDENRTPLHLAVMKNRYFYAEYLIKCGADIKALSKLNASVFHFALIPGSYQSLMELCSMINLIKSHLLGDTHLFNCCTLDGWTPLVFLASHPTFNLAEQHKDLFKELMETFTKDMQKNEKQILLAFDMVAQRHQLKKFHHLEILVKKSSLQTRIQIAHLACRHNNTVFLSWILKQVGQDCEYAGFTPLLTATFYNAESCVEELLKMNTSGNSKIDIKELYCKSEDLKKNNIFHICAKRQVLPTLFNKLVEKLDDEAFLQLMQAQDSEGNLPLHLAVRENLSTDTAQEPMDVHDSKGNVVLHIIPHLNEVKSHICEQMLKQMNQIRPDPDPLILDILSTKNRLGKTPIHEASQQNHIDNIKLMWEAIPKASRKNREKGFFKCDDNRFTCVHLAAANGNREVLTYLIETVGMEVDSIGDRRLTPLHLACQFGHLDAVKYLIGQRASITLRNAQLYNCLEISIMEQHETIVKYLFSLHNWRGMMRNAQRIKNTEAFDTPMRKLIRYMPDVTLWMIEEKLTRRVGGQEQKVCKDIYDYEFYEDMHTVKQWYAQDGPLPKDDMSCRARWNRLGVNVIFGNCCCNHHQSVDEQKGFVYQPYTRDAYTRVRNHPLILVSQQSNYPDLMEHQFHVSLRKKMYRRFGTYWLAFSFLFYIILVGVWTGVILNGKHPQYFYELLNMTMTSDVDTCERVATRLILQNTIEAFKTIGYRRLKFILYCLFIIVIAKNGVMIIALFPKVFRTGGHYCEASALVLSFIYVLDWYDWQEPLIFRCPIQYQIGAMGIFLSWMNLLTYVRCIPWFNIGIYVAMLQVIFFKFLRFLPVLLIIICGFGFTYWMLLQNQTVFASPIEALIRTSLMIFDLGYESRIYGSPDQPAYYKLVYVIIICTAVVFCIFIINLMIGLAVGEIPSLVVQGTLWRSQMLYNLLSDYEILRLQICRLGNFLSCYRICKTSWIRRRPTLFLTHDKISSGLLRKAWYFTNKYFFNEQIQDSVMPKTKKKQVDEEEE